MHSTAVLCCAVLCSALHCCALHCTAVLCSTRHCSALLCSLVALHGEFLEGQQSFASHPIIRILTIMRPSNPHSLLTLFSYTTPLLHSMYANPDVWCCLLSGQASSGSHLVDCDPVEEGGVIGCQINSNDGTVTFYRNDEFLLQFDNLNDHPAMRNGNGDCDTVDPMSRGVRPFVCLEIGGDSITYMGPKCDEAIVTFPESDQLNRFSFSGNIVNGDFDGLCEQHLWRQDGRWMGHYKDGLREGTHVCVIPKIIPLKPLTSSDLDIPEDFIPEKSLRSPELDDLKLKSLENEVSGDVKLPLEDSCATDITVNNPVKENKNENKNESEKKGDDKDKNSNENENENENNDKIENEKVLGSAIDSSIPLLTSTSTTTAAATATATSTSVPLVAPSIPPVEEFSVMVKYEKYERGAFVRDLTPEEIETDPVVLECRKIIEEESGKIILDRLAALKGGAAFPLTVDKKKKLQKKTKTEKSKPKTG